jgi:hypothetical protein
MTILGLLPISALLLLWLVLPGKTQYLGGRFLDALLVWGICIVLFTEGLSLFGLLRPGWTTVLWLLLVLILLVWLARSGQGMRDKILRGLAAVCVEQKTLTAGLLTICVITLLIALIAPPNNWDSLVFHMTRVANWVQNGSVRHYQTYTDRQLYPAPFAEFAILQFQLLTGGDRFANLVQWVSMIGSLTAVCLIAKRLGANRPGQGLAVVYAATIPMGILQSTSTQTDYAVTLWLACFVYFLLTERQTPQRWNAVKLGLTLGLAILTKVTAYIYALPFLLWYFLSKLRTQPGKVLSQAAIISAAVIILNVGHYYRNFSWFGSIMSPPYEVDKNSNDRFGADVTLSNIIRNITFHLGTHRQDINNFTRNIAYKLHGLIGIDINDPSTTKNPPYRIGSLSTHEDVAGNPLHFLLGTLSAFLILLHPTIRRKQLLLTYVCMVALGFLLFCFYIKWSPWRQRLHLPLFVLMATAVGIAISELLSGRYVRLVAYGLLISSLPWLLTNKSRPLIPVAPFSKNRSILTTDRVSQYFANRPHLKIQYLQAVEVLNRMPCRTIGFVSGGDDWEYPLFVLLQQTGKRFTVTYPTVPLPDPAADQICTVVYVGDGKARQGERHGDADIHEWADLAIVHHPKEKL